MQVGDPWKDHECWERPEDMDTERTVYNISAGRPGSEVAGETAAALAAASMVFRDADPEYAETLLVHARKAFEFADTYKGAYSDDPDLRAGGCPFYCDFDGYQVSSACPVPGVSVGGDMRSGGSASNKNDCTNKYVIFNIKQIVLSFFLF